MQRCCLPNKILISANHLHLNTLNNLVRLGLHGGPTFVPSYGGQVKAPQGQQRNLLTSTSLYVSLQLPLNFARVEELLQVNILQYKNRKKVTRLKQDQEAVSLLKSQTLTVDSIARD